MASHGALLVFLFLASHGDAAFMRTEHAVAPASKAKRSENLVSALNSSDLIAGNRTLLSNVHGVHGRSGDCDRPEVAAMLASAGIFDSGLSPAFPESDLQQYKQHVASAGLSEVKRYETRLGHCHFQGDHVNDSDAAALFKNGAYCLLVFRGSNCMADMEDVPVSIFKYGYEINQKVLTEEFEPLIGKMNQSDYADCATLDVTGFSLGGSLATIFAVLRNAEEIKFGPPVTNLFAFAPAPVFHGSVVTNKNSTDGCFRGGSYCSFVMDSGVPKMDPVCAVGEGLSGPKAKFVKLGQATGETTCDQGMESIGQQEPASTWMPAHFPQIYIQGLGCEEAEISGFDWQERCEPFKGMGFCPE